MIYTNSFVMNGLAIGVISEKTIYRSITLLGDKFMFLYGTESINPPLAVNVDD